MMPSSTGWEQSTVNLRVCLRFTNFLFAFLIACAAEENRATYSLRKEKDQHPCGAS